MNDKKILIIIAHPDDEVLWMGGTICKLIQQGYSVNILLLSSPWNARKEEKKNIRLECFQRIVAQLWIDEVFQEFFPDTGFDTIPLLTIIQSIEKVIQKIEPSVIYTHFYNDLNIDHALTARSVITALRPIERFHFIKKIYLFEILSSTELSIGKDQFLPNHYEDIGDFLDYKKQLFQLYISENQSFPYARNIEWLETLARIRWMESWLPYAESFMLYRSIH